MSTLMKKVDKLLTDEAYDEAGEDSRQGPLKSNKVQNDDFK